MPGQDDDTGHALYQDTSFIAPKGKLTPELAQKISDALSQGGRVKLSPESGHEDLSLSFNDITLNPKGSLHLVAGRHIILIGAAKSGSETLAKIILESGCTDKIGRVQISGTQPIFTTDVIEHYVHDKAEDVSALISSKKYQRLLYLNSFQELLDLRYHNLKVERDGKGDIFSYALWCDVDAKQITSNTGWSPLILKDAIFDGCGHTIKNFFLTGHDEHGGIDPRSGGGLYFIDFLSESQFKNLTLDCTICVDWPRDGNPYPDIWFATIINTSKKSVIENIKLSTALEMRPYIAWGGLIFEAQDTRFFNIQSMLKAKGKNPAKIAGIAWKLISSELFNIKVDINLDCDQDKLDFCENISGISSFSRSILVQDAHISGKIKVIKAEEPDYVLFHRRVTAGINSAEKGITLRNFHSNLTCEVNDAAKYAPLVGYLAGTENIFDHCTWSFPPDDKTGVAELEEGARFTHTDEKRDDGDDDQSQSPPKEPVKLD